MGELLLVNQYTDNVSKRELTWRLFTELTVMVHPILHICLGLVHRARILQVEHLLGKLRRLCVLNLNWIVTLRGQEQRLRVVLVNEPTVVIVVVHIYHLNSIVVR